MGPAMHVVTVRDPEALNLHWSSWDELAKNGPPGGQSLQPAWVAAHLRHILNEKERWFCCFAYEGDHLVGVLPVIVSPHRLLGSAWPLLHTPFDGHTPTGNVLLDPNHARSAFMALLAETKRHAPRHLGLDIGGVRQGSPLWEVLQGKTDCYFGSWGKVRMYGFLNVQGDFDAYLASLNKSQRRELRSDRKKLESLGPVSVERKTGDAFLGEFLALEASGWKGRAGTAILNDPKRVAFYTTMARNYAEQGDLEWHVLRVGEQVAAVQMGIRCGASLNSPKIAFDENFASARPGFVLVVEMIKNLFSRQDINEYNPMSNSPQNRLLRMVPYEYVDVHLVRRSIASTAFHLPRILTRSLYENHVVPRIPESLKEAYRNFRRRRNGQGVRAQAAGGETQPVVRP